MISNHLKIAFRNLQRQKGFTALNVLGLAVGIAAVLLIYRIVRYELSFNQHFNHYDRIVRVVTSERTREGGVEPSVCIPIPAMEAMRQSVPQFEAMCRVREAWPNIIVPNPAGGPPLKKFSPQEDHPELSFFAEPSFFRIFNLRWLAGDPATALNDLGSVVLSETMAKKCFDDWRMAMGKTLLLDNLVPVTVKGVVEDMPVNCDLPFNALISYATLKPNAHLYFYDEEWGACSSNNQVYAMLGDAGQLESANAALAKVGEKEYSENGYRSKYHELQPMPTLHYDERYHTSSGQLTPKSRLWVLASIGILILVMACFNFINLTTAQASLRAKEVGVRKTLGGDRGRLIGQFMSETALVVAFSVMLGGMLAFVGAPLLKHISDVPDQHPFFSDPALWAFLGTTALAVTLFAGLYPAAVLSGFNPIQALKSNVQQGKSGGVFLRKSLVVLQFFIAQALVIGAIVIIGQLDYVRSRDLGFDKNLVYTFPMNSDSATIARQQTLKNRLLEIAAVEAVSLCSDQPSSGNTWSSNFRFGTHSDDEPFNTSLKFCDADWQKTYGFRLRAGRWLEPSDTMREAIVNETMLRKLGISQPEEAVGQNIRLGGRRVMKVVGVVEDFHTHSLREEHEPTLITTRARFYSQVGIKMRPDNMEATTAAVQKIFDEILPEQVFDGSFLDESIANFYRNETRFSATCKGFGSLAIFISCLGLLGLAAHAAQRRTKEIGIRKVLGASVAGITGLLAKDFLKLVLVSFVLAVPIAYWFMQKWLADFAYRIDMQWWMFAVAGIAAVLIAFITVSFQSIKAALTNPVKSLRSE
ncbi:MAG: ABC transporter permease [Saprospiraceae bacterium]|nr:ABC transporter permease [Saprospiraceae bacterium]